MTRVQSFRRCAIVGGLLASLVGAATSAVPANAAAVRVHRASAHTPTVSVIVFAQPGQLVAAQAAARNLGATVTHVYFGLEGFTATMPSGSLVTLQADPSVRR